MFSAFSIKYPNDNIDSFCVLSRSHCIRGRARLFHSANSNISICWLFLLYSCFFSTSSFSFEWVLFPYFIFFLFRLCVICSIVFYWHIERFSTQRISLFAWICRLFFHLLDLILIVFASSTSFVLYKVFI